MVRLSARITFLARPWRRNTTPSPIRVREGRNCRSWREKSLYPRMGPTYSLASLYFYGSISPVGLAIMLGSVGADYLLARPLFLWGKGDKRAQICRDCQRSCQLFSKIRIFSSL